MDENEPTTDTQALSAAAVELIQHLTALRRGAPLADFHRSEAFDLIDVLTSGIA